MVHKESIGKVVGNDGITYEPKEFIEGTDNTVQIKFVNTKNPSDIKTTTSTVKMPYYVPKVVTEGKNKKIVFELNSASKPPEIPFSEIKGDPGAAGEIETGFIDINNYDINQLKTGVLYLSIEGDDTDDKEELNTYVVVKKNEQNILKKINSVISISNYYNKDEIDDKELAIYTYIETQLQGILEEQQNINNILMRGTPINENEYSTGTTEMSIVSDASIADIKEQLVEMLAEYITEDDIQYDEDNAIINIKL